LHAAVLALRDAPAASGHYEQMEVLHSVRPSVRYLGFTQNRNAVETFIGHLLQLQYE